MTNKERNLRELVEKADHDRVEAYIGLFDRILLYNIASKIVPKESLEQSIRVWDMIIKKGIDSDVVKRTNFLEETVIGRASKFQDEPDGEEFRLHCLKQIDIAKSVIENNLKIEEQDNDGFDSGEFEGI